MEGPHLPRPAAAARLLCVKSQEAVHGPSVWFTQGFADLTVGTVSPLAIHRAVQSSDT